MNYVFCPSYGSVFFALHLINTGQAASIITDNVSIRKFCVASNVPHWYFDPIDIPLLKPWRALALRRKIKSLLQDIRYQPDDVFYLLDNSFDINAFYLAKEWSRRARVRFNAVGRYFPLFNEKGVSQQYFMRQIKRRCLKLWLGLDLIFLDAHGYPAWGIGDTFIRKNKIEVFTADQTLSEMQLEAMHRNPVRLSPVDNLITTDGNLAGIATPQSLVNAFQSLLDLPYKFVVKFHPQTTADSPLDEYEKLLKKLEELPDYLPVELLLPNVRHSVISVFSVSLTTASRLGHLKIISLLDLIQWNSEVYKEETRVWLKKECHNNVLFPRTIAELRRMLVPGGDNKRYNDGSEF